MRGYNIKYEKYKCVSFLKVIFYGETACINQLKTADKIHNVLSTQ